MAAGAAELAVGAGAGGDLGERAVGDEGGEAVAGAGEGGVGGDAALVEGGAGEPGVGEVGLRRRCRRRRRAARARYCWTRGIEALPPQ